MSEDRFLKEKELLLNTIENNTREHWKNYYKDVSIENIYDDLVIDIKEIKRLQNNWNELKKWLESNHRYSEFAVWEIISKMQKLEGKNNNEEESNSK